MSIDIDDDHRLSSAGRWPNGGGVRPNSQNHPDCRRPGNPWISMETLFPLDSISYCAFFLLSTSCPPEPPIRLEETSTPSQVARPWTQSKPSVRIGIWTARVGAQPSPASAQPTLSASRGARRPRRWLQACWGGVVLETFRSPPLGPQMEEQAAW